MVVYVFARSRVCLVMVVYVLRVCGTGCQLVARWCVHERARVCPWCVWTCMWAYVRLRVRVLMCACVRACVRACVSVVCGRAVVWLTRHGVCSGGRVCACVHASARRARLPARLRRHARTHTHAHVRAHTRPGAHALRPHRSCRACAVRTCTGVRARTGGRVRARARVDAGRLDTAALRCSKRSRGRDHAPARR